MRWPKRCKKSPFQCLGYHPKILVSVGWILPNQLSPEPENLDSNIIQSLAEVKVLSVSDKEIKLLPKLVLDLEGRKRLKYLISILIDSHIFIFVFPLFRTLKAIRKLFIDSIPKFTLLLRFSLRIKKQLIVWIGDRGRIGWIGCLQARNVYFVSFLFYSEFFACYF